MFSESSSCPVNQCNCGPLFSRTLKCLWFCAFRLEVKQLLQANADLQKELEDVKGGEEERRGREEALR